MPVNKVKEYLEKNNVKFVSMTHSPAFTSQEIAAAAHVSGKHMAKTVITKMDGQFAMVVIPANQHINFSNLRSASGVKTADLASESEFKDKFPGCEVGAMPPFGELYGMPVYLAASLSNDENLVFNAGSHSELMQVSYADFARLAKPTLLEI